MRLAEQASVERGKTELSSLFNADMRRGLAISMALVKYSVLITVTMITTNVVNDFKSDTQCLSYSTLTIRA